MIPGAWHLKPARTDAFRLRETGLGRGIGRPGTSGFLFGILVLLLDLAASDDHALAALVAALRTGSIPLTCFSASLVALLLWLGCVRRVDTFLAVMERYQACSWPWSPRARHRPRRMGCDHSALSAGFLCRRPAFVSAARGLRRAGSDDVGFGLRTLSRSSNIRLIEPPYTRASGQNETAENHERRHL